MGSGRRLGESCYGVRERKMRRHSVGEEGFVSITGVLFTRVRGRSGSRVMGGSCMRSCGGEGRSYISVCFGRFL